MAPSPTADPKYRGPTAKVNQAPQTFRSKQLGYPSPPPCPCPCPYADPDPFP